MRFLPLFLDLQSGVVLLVGAGDLVRAKLRLLVSAGAQVRWFATDGNHDLSGLDADDVARIGLAKGDPLASDLGGVIAILCAGAGSIGVAMSVRAKAVGLPVNVMDDLAHSTSSFPPSLDRGDVVVAVGTGGTSPVAALACASASRRYCRHGSAILQLIGGFQIDACAHSRIFCAAASERVSTAHRRAGVAGHTDEAAKALQAVADPSAFAGANKAGKQRAV
jgi:uroporphyrin-III C-methyltransferase/precorrin-2 dehydrogenase/sirohydrochlorin ferrochelatase